jgi:hypothetical protein
MPKNSTLIENVSSDQFMELMVFMFRKELESFKKELSNQSANDDLMSREQVLDFLKIDASTLYRYQCANKIAVYKLSNKCFYKRNEILESLIKLKK